MTLVTDRCGVRGPMPFGIIRHHEKAIVREEIRLRGETC